MQNRVAIAEHAQTSALPVPRRKDPTALDAKTAELTYLAVLAALRIEGGVQGHVQAAKQAGASRAEVMDAILLGLPAENKRASQVLAAASGAYDSDPGTDVAYSVQ